MRRLKPYSVLAIVLTLASFFGLAAQEEGAAVPTPSAADVDILWICMAAFLVFLMQAGFAYVEAGFIRTKNVVNILMKNVSDFSAGSVVFWLFGFSLMFGPLVIDGVAIGPFTTADAYLETPAQEPIAYNYAFFIFQLVFCATAATIVSGAMAERTKFYVYLISTVIISGLVYPVFGSTAWSNLLLGDNEGFLVQLGFIDFAGSTVVHSLGGWVGMAGAIALGPRIGKYQPDGRILPIFGHNMSMATLGVFLLWLGWFGFNPGSTLSIADGSIAIIAVNTNIAAAVGALGAMMTSWILFRRPDISMVLNGALAGLVAITAPCANVSVTGAATIGLVAGILVVFSVIFFDKIHIDDPVGAISVHGVAGAWGTLSVGLFAHPMHGGVSGLFYGGDLSVLGVQALGVAMCFVWAFGIGLILFFLLRFTLGLRVSPEEELEGLDIIEHGNEAYPENH
ncbi:MAG: ammonium transporter [Leptospiraceae bacterium]|nr:ammonium transporter [Leptospiraceae bacterium]